MANGKTKIEERISEAGEQSEEQKKQVFEWLEKNMKVDYIDWKSISDGWYVVGGSGDQKKFVPFSAIIEGKISIPMSNEFVAIDNEVFKKFYKEWLKTKQRDKIEELESLFKNTNIELAGENLSSERKEKLEWLKPYQEERIKKAKKAAGITEKEPSLKTEI